MTEKQLSGVQARLDRFFEVLVEPMGRSERRPWVQVYFRGLLLDGQRKSVQQPYPPMSPTDTLRGLVPASPLRDENLF